MEDFNHSSNRAPNENARWKPPGVCSIDLVDDSLYANRELLLPALFLTERSLFFGRALRFSFEIRLLKFRFRSQFLSPLDASFFSERFT